jgi:hypothetical protein
MLAGRPGQGCKLEIRHINFLTVASVYWLAAPALLKE